MRIYLQFGPKGSEVFSEIDVDDELYDICPDDKKVKFILGEIEPHVEAMLIKLAGGRDEDDLPMA